MDLKLKDKSFLICGASSGFGFAVAQTLLHEGARIYAVSRSGTDPAIYGGGKENKLVLVQADLTQPGAISTLAGQINFHSLSGAFINAGGPPAKSFLETIPEDWDEAYRTLLRWKVELAKELTRAFLENNYGRLVFLESMSVKQPINSLVLSNSLRLAVVGFVKSLSNDIADRGVTLNILAPGYHETSAVDRILKKKAEQGNSDLETAKGKIISEIPVRKMGSTEDLASLACWLLSESSRFLTGQTISVDGGSVKGVFG